MEPTKVAGVLAETPLFADLAPGTVEAIAHQAAIRTFSKGSRLFNQGDPGDAFYLLSGGAVKVVVTSSQGDEMVLATLRPPDSLGEVALLDRGERSASAEALELVTVIAFARSTILDLMRSQPEIGDAILGAAGRLLRRLTGQHPLHLMVRPDRPLSECSDGTPSRRLRQIGSRCDLYSPNSVENACHRALRVGFRAYELLGNFWFVDAYLDSGGGQRADYLIEMDNAAQSGAWCVVFHRKHYGQSVEGAFRQHDTGQGAGCQRASSTRPNGSVGGSTPIPATVAPSRAHLTTVGIPSQQNGLNLSPIS